MPVCVCSIATSLHTSHHVSNLFRKTWTLATNVKRWMLTNTPASLFWHSVIFKEVKRDRSCFRTSDFHRCCGIACKTSAAWSESQYKGHHRHCFSCITLTSGVFLSASFNTDFNNSDRFVAHINVPIWHFSSSEQPNMRAGFLKWENLLRVALIWVLDWGRLGFLD